MIRSKVLGISLLLLGSVLSGSALAEIMIEQGKIEIRANPGETIVDTITVHNTSKNQPMRLRVSWEDFTYVEPYDGKKEFMAQGTGPNSASGWVTYSPQEFTLEALATKKITYSFQIPETAKGGYYGVLLLQEGGDSNPGQIGVSIVTRVGSLFFIETTNSNKIAKIENVAVAGKTFTADFLNQGDVIMIPNATFYVLDKDGLVADRGEIKKFYLPPGAKTNFEVAFSDKLAAGNYSIILTFDLGEGSSVVKEIEFSQSDKGDLTIVKVQD